MRRGAPLARDSLDPGYRQALIAVKVGTITSRYHSDAHPAGIWLLGGGQVGLGRFTGAGSLLHHLQTTKSSTLHSGALGLRVDYRHKETLPTDPDTGAENPS